MTLRVPLGAFWKRPQPILAVLLIAVGWALSHQVGSNAIFDSCANRRGAFVVAVSLVGLLVTAAGGAYGLLASRASVGRGRRFFGIFAALLALPAGFAIILQVIAGIILPACAG